MNQQDVVRHLNKTDILFGLDGNILQALAEEITPVTLGLQDVLFDRDDTINSVFFIKEGVIQITTSANSSAQLLAERMSGESVGISMLVGQRAPFAASVSKGPARLFSLSRSAWDRLRNTYSEVFSVVQERAAVNFDRLRLGMALHESKAFHSLNKETLTEVQTTMDLQFVPSGSQLFQKGDLSDYLYLVVSGRFLILTDSDQGEKILGELHRGDVFGEIGILLDWPRAAHIRALRDSTVGRLSKEALLELLVRHPVAVNRATTAMIAHHLIKPARPVGSMSPRTLALVPIQSGVSLQPLADLLGTALSIHGATLTLAAERLERVTGLFNAAQIKHDDFRNNAIVNVLSDLELSYKHLLFVADQTDTPWTRRCLRQADIVLFVANADGTPALGENERMFAAMSVFKTLKSQLVLVHKTKVAAPEGTLAWLAPRDCSMHHHIQSGNMDDVARLARFLTGKAVGLVLGGGGSRGFAHIGVLKALEDHRIPIDLVGGTSMGALIAAQYALQWSPDEILERTRHLASGGPSFTLPIVSLFSGKKVIRKVIKLFGEILIEDLWRRYFAISCNLSRAKMKVHDKDLLWEAVIASNNPPGLFPPTAHKEGLLVDGALLNNVPVDVMATYNPSGVTLAVDVNPREDFLGNPRYRSDISGWDILLSRLNPFKESIISPNIVEVITRASNIGGLSQRNKGISGYADLYLQPPVGKYGLMEHRKADEIVEAGYNYASKEIKEWQDKRGS